MLYGLPISPAPTLCIAKMQSLLRMTPAGRNDPPAFKSQLVFDPLGDVAVLLPDNNDGSSRGRERFDAAKNSRAGVAIETIERFVQNQQLRRADERARHKHEPALSKR